MRVSRILKTLAFCIFLLACFIYALARPVQPVHWTKVGETGFHNITSTIAFPADIWSTEGCEVTAYKLGHEWRPISAIGYDRDTAACLKLFKQHPPVDAIREKPGPQAWASFLPNRKARA